MPPNPQNGSLARNRVRTRYRAHGNRAQKSATVAYMRFVSWPARLLRVCALCCLGACVADAHVYRSARDAPETDGNAAVSAAGREAPRGGLCSAASKLLSEAESGASAPQPCESD